VKATTTGTIRVSRYQKGRNQSAEFPGARDSEWQWQWQWHQLGHMQICTSPRQITMPASHHLVFYRPGAFLPPNEQRKSTEGSSKCWRQSESQITPIQPNFNILWGNMDRKVPQHESRQGELPAEPRMGQAFRYWWQTQEGSLMKASDVKPKCPIHGSAGSSPCLDSCCGTLRSMLPHSMFNFGCVGVI